MKSHLTHGLAFYLGFGAALASLMAASIPAMNWRGKAYVILAWPQMLYCADENSGCDPSPPTWLHAFTSEAAP